MAEAVFIRIGEGEKAEVGHAAAFEFLGSVGEMSAVVSRVGPGMRTVPPHYHRHHAEAILVLGGELEMTLGDEVVTASSGCLALIPAGVVHAFGNVGSEPATFLEIYAPGGFENFIRDLAEALPSDAPIDSVAFGDLVRRHDIVYP